VAVILIAASHAQAPSGEEIFRNNCAGCHTGTLESKAPSRDALRRRSPEGILDALLGEMLIPGSRLNGAERRAVAEYLTGRRLGGQWFDTGTGRCALKPQLDAPEHNSHWNGWGAGISNSRFQPAEQARLSVAEVSRLKLKWAFGFVDASAAWAQPTVAAGRVFVGSQNSQVYALDAKTGCLYWAFEAKGGVRTAVTVSAITGHAGTYAAYFADTTAHVYAVNAATGDLIMEPQGRRTPARTRDRRADAV
jgi:polyvinyl alcohol dehydrogenase (cytochrome)